MTRKITVHTIVCNEERFIWYTIKSVVNFVDQLLIFDTGSTDKTVSIIQSIKNKKIVFEPKGRVNRQQLVQLRQEQIDRTQTEWFYILDGDEVYPTKTIQAVTSAIQSAPPNYVGLYLPFSNSVGDIYHKQQEKYGRYHIANKTGHINLRGIKKLPRLKVSGQYPLEAYQDQHGTKIQDYPPSDLLFITQPFFHAGSLRRSSLDRGVMERKMVYDLGLPINQTHLPKIFFSPHPRSTPSVIGKRSLSYILLAFIFSIMRFFKYIYEKN